MSKIKLKPCPFCGEKQNALGIRPLRNSEGAQVRVVVSIYCACGGSLTAVRKGPVPAAVTKAAQRWNHRV